MLALSAPFMAERRFWITSNAQAEAQRDAQLVLRAIARHIREGRTYEVLNGGQELRVGGPWVCTVSPFMKVFELHAGGELHFHDCNGNTLVLIDGIRSEVQNFTVTPIAMTNNLLHIQLDVLYNNLENEVVETQVFLRNAT